MATFETFVAGSWISLPKGKELFDKAATSGVPIKVVHPNGSFKVIRNGDKLPEAEPTTSTKPKAETETETKAKAKAEPKPNEAEATEFFIDPSMVGA